MQMHAFPISPDSQPLPPLLFFQATKPITYPFSLFPPTARIINPIPSSLSSQAFVASSRPLSKLRSSNLDTTTSFDDDDGDDADSDFSASSFSDEDSHSDGRGIEIKIENIGKNSRRIRSKIVVEASLELVWSILTDYERLTDFIPGLAVSQLLEKRENFARLLQIGQQSLAFGLKFKAKGIVDCYEKDLERLPFGQRRDIEFKMIEGDFKLFEGKWSIEQCNIGRCTNNDSLAGQQFYTSLSYVVDVEPKLWLPVRVVEGRLCKEIKMNLSCIREEAEKTTRNTLRAC
ncbi:hypothetical protein F0562_021530 [Nyssa sinensis]|uniref:Coenzyme Q-binding protein COQ10 START domain-containing protein n=1 Tax=Nyssa sinensis TaxID=561372 RepID=A0A5J5BIJ2_9ASTE|nr:hypothetical protein F0562_021530 [Nyssa sinensis]